MSRSPEEILELSSAEPARAMNLAYEYLNDPDRSDDRGKALVYRGMSMASRLLGRFEDAVEFAGQSREAAVAAGDDEQHLLAVLTMTGPMAVTGKPDDAFELIRASTTLATTPYLEGRVAFQRGAIRALGGDVTSAIPEFESALVQFREAGDTEMLRQALQNLGNMKIVIGNLAQAAEHLDEALEIAVARNEGPAISGIKHNLGLLASYRGDIPEALELLTASDEIFMSLTGATAPQHPTRCAVLMSAGLFREAHGLARAIAEGNRAAGDAEHLGESLLVTARAALAAGNLAEALATAEESADLLGSQDRSTMAADARRVAVEARYQIDGASGELFEMASNIAAELETENLMVAASQAHLLAGHIAIELGDDAAAIASLEPVAAVRSGPVELRIQAKTARALLRVMKGDGRGADAAARSGLRLLDEYQRALGATDLRMGLEQHGSELGSIGLGLALASGRPRRILRWMENTRARSLRHRPVVSERDDEVHDALARVRQVDAELRKPDERRNRDLQAERRRLQEQVRAFDRRRRATTPGEKLADERLIDALQHRCLFEFAIHDNKVVGVLLRKGRASHVELGGAERVLGELGHVRFGMRRAARRGRPIGPDSLATLDAMLLGDVGLGEEELVVVPPPELMAVPWSGLPSLVDRPVTVSPSAEMWWRANRQDTSGASVVVAGGPDLSVAGGEVTAVGDLYENSRVFPPGSSVAEVKGALPGASVAHIACHAVFQVENPMFSSLRLGDGDLSVYDIERLHAPPSVVVLSACDSGYTETRSGDELAGLTSALLTMGSRSVIAGVGLVPDTPATSDLMVDLHRGMIDGLSPSHALAAAQARMSRDPDRFVAASSFICVGA